MSRLKKRNESSPLAGEKGAVLPIVLAAFFLLNLIFLGSHQVYRNQMSQSILLVNHYQSQTQLTLAEKVLEQEYSDKERELPQRLIFSTGSVEIKALKEESCLLISRLRNGYTEEKEIAWKKQTKEEPEAAVLLLFFVFLSFAIFVIIGKVIFQRKRGREAVK